MPSDGTDTPLDRVRFLTRADSRVRVLEHLLGSGALSQRTLRSRLDASRTTVSRALQSLQSEGWVERAAEGYRLTRAGRIVTAELTGLIETVAAVDDLAEFLRWFPAEVDAPDFHTAGDITVTYSMDADPYAPGRKQTQIFDTADRIRILLPAIDLDSTETLHEQVTERGLEVETVVSSGVESTMESDEFAPLMRAMIETGRSTLLVAQEQPPFYLGLADDGRVQIGLADDEGFPRALLETTDDDISAWAEARYRQYRAGARRKPVEELE